MPNVVVNWSVAATGADPQIISAVAVAFAGQSTFAGAGDTRLISALPVALDVHTAFAGAGDIVGLGELGTVGGDLYDELRPIADPYDAERGYPLLAYAKGLGSMFQELDDIVNHPEDLVQPDRAPAKWLPWLGQFIGAGIPPGGSGNVEADRAAIKDPPRRRRGTVDAILEEVSVGLQPGAVIFFSERDVGGSAYHGQITVRQSDLRPGESLSTIRTRVQRAKPSLVLIDVYVTTGGDYAALRTTHATYAQVTSVFRDYDEVRRNPVKQ